MLQTEFQGQRSNVLKKKIFEGFYHIWAWWPKWPCNLDGLNMFPSPLSLEALYEILFQLAQWPLRCLQVSYYESPGSNVRE